MRSPAHAKKLFGCTMLVLALSAAAFAAEFWDKKDYTQWSDKDCRKLLEKSPWATDYTQVGSAVGFGGSADSTDSQAPYVKYVIQFRSAKPIQQAMIRQLQIANKYDSLSAEQKQQFDKSADAFIKSMPADGVVVHVTYSTNNQQHMRDLLRHWQSQTADLLKHSVYLSGSKSGKVPLAAFAAGAAGRGEFQFIFPRTVDGKPVLSPEDKQLTLEFAYPVVGGIGDGRGYIEFKLEKMKFQDQISY